MNNDLSIINNKIFNSIVNKIKKLRILLINQNKNYLVIQFIIIIIIN